MPMTVHGKTVALQALAERRANQPKKIDNNSLYAGSPMYFYCLSCGAEIVVPESYLRKPDLCEECQALKAMGWLEE